VKEEILAEGKDPTIGIIASALSAKVAIMIPK